MDQAANRVSSVSNKVGATATDMAGADIFPWNAARTDVECGSLLTHRGIERPWRMSQWDKDGTLGMASKVLKNARLGAMNSARRRLHKSPLKLKIRDQMLRRIKILRKFDNGDNLGSAQSVAEYKQTEAPVRMDVINVLPSSVAPRGEVTSSASNAPPTLAEVITPKHSRTGEKRKRVDNEISVESQSPALALMDRPGKRKKVALATDIETTRLDSHERGTKRKNMEENCPVQVPNPAHTLEDRQSKRVKVNDLAITTRTTLEKKPEASRKQLYENGTMELARSTSTIMESSDQAKDLGLPEAVTSSAYDPKESKEGRRPSTSIETLNSAHATVQRAIEQLKASMPAEIDTSNSDYLGIETTLKTELLKILKDSISDKPADLILGQSTKGTSEEQGSAEASTVEHQTLLKHKNFAQKPKPGAVENQSSPSLIPSDGVDLETYINKTNRVCPSGDDDQEVRHDTTQSTRRQKTEQSLLHQTLSRQDIGATVFEERPPGWSRVIRNGRPPRRRRRSSSPSVTAGKEGSLPHTLIQVDRDPQESDPRASVSLATEIRQTAEANVGDITNNSMRLGGQSKARAAPSDMETTIPARKGPTDSLEAIKGWYLAIHEMQDNEKTREARKKSEEEQVEPVPRTKETRPVKCSENLCYNFEILCQSERPLNDLPAECGAEVGAKVRLDGLSSPARVSFHESKAARIKKGSPKLNVVEAFEDRPPNCRQRKPSNSRDES